MAIYSRDELLLMGFKQVGVAPQISTKASFYGCQHIVLGDYVRIDDFCVLSAGNAGITFGNYIHIGVFTSMIGQGHIHLNHYCNISSKVAIYSSNDDYSGDFMTNPMIPSQYSNVSHADVFFDEHVIVGSGSVVLPGVNVGKGCAVGALSLVTKDLDDWGVYVGQPVKWIKSRSRSLLQQEKLFINSLKHR